MADDFQSYLQGLIAEEVAKGASGQTTNQGGDPASTAPITFKMGNQDFKFKDNNELQNFITQFGTEVATYTQNLQSQISAAPKVAEVTGLEKAPEWDLNQFVTKMTSDPREAINYSLNHLLFEGKAENAAEELKARLSKSDEVDQMQRALAAATFKERHPEYPGGVQVANVIDGVRQEYNLPYNANGLEAAYTLAINRGALPNFPTLYQQAQLQQQQQNQGQERNNVVPFPQSGGYQPPPGTGPMNPAQFNGGFNFQNNPYLQAPPGVGRNGPTTGYPNPDPEDLSTEQIEAIMSKVNNFGGR